MIVGVADGPDGLIFFKSSSTDVPLKLAAPTLKVLYLLGISASPCLSNYRILAIFSASIAA